jgi:hypothetical protein
MLALAVAAVLSVVAAVVLRPPTAPEDPRLVPFDTTAVTSFSIKDSQATRTLTRDAPGASWILSVANTDGSMMTWPADTSAIKSALANLASVAHLGPVEPLVGLPSCTISLEFPTGSITLRAGSTALAGRATIEVSRDNTITTSAAPAGTLAAFTGPITTLLDPAVLRWPSEPTRLTLVRPDRTINLERVGRSWRLTSPIAAPADRKVVGEMQAALSNLRLASAAPVPSGLAPLPALKVQITTGTAESPFVQSISFVSATGSQATATSPQGSASLILRDPDLEPIFVDLAAILSKQALDRPAADIMAAMLLRPGDELAEPRVVRRDADRWLLADQPLPEADAKTFVALLETLCVTPAAATLLETPADFEPLATLRLQALDKVTLGDVSIGLSTPQAAAAGGIKRRVLTIVTTTSNPTTTGSVARLYPVMIDDPMLAFLRANLP